MGQAEGSYYSAGGYRLRHEEEGRLTEAMEDYLEMLCRCAQPGESMRVRSLARQLHVRPSSVSKMVAQLKALGLVEAEPYGAVTVTPQGRVRGDYLLHRHQVLLRFFHLLGNIADPLEQVELIEHHLTPQTVASLEALTLRLEAETKSGSPDP